MLLYGDNQSALVLTKNPELYQRTKYINVKYYYIRQQYERELIDLWFIPTDKIATDGLTKPLAYPKFKEFVRLLNLQLVEL